MNLAAELKETFKKGNALAKLIYINLGVYVLVLVGFIFFYFFQVGGTFEFLRVGYLDSILRYLCVPADVHQLVFQPWSVITYAFLHQDFFHILFNLIALYFFGRVFLRFLDEKKIYGVYVLGALSGALLYILVYNIFPVFEESVNQAIMLGASASVMAVLFAITFYKPRLELQFLLIGKMRLMYVSLAFVVLDLLMLPRGSNPGGHIAHLGGAIFGMVYASQLLKGRDMSRGFNRILDKIFSIFSRKPGRNVRVTHKRAEDDWQFRQRKADEQEELDRILEKIKKSGYDSLSKKEKEILFRMSNN